MGQVTCPTCGVKFHVPSAEDFSFNSDGACERCGGTGKVRQLDESKLITDPNLSIKGRCGSFLELTWKELYAKCS